MLTVKNALSFFTGRNLLLYFLKLNVDGSRNNHGVIGAGGIIIDNSGIWIKGFTHHIGVGEVIQAEAWGIFLGLKLASDLCIRNLVVECDSAADL